MRPWKERINAPTRIVGALVAAPILSLIGFSMHPKVYPTGTELLANIEAHSTSWNLSHTILFFDAMLWLLAVRTLVRLLKPHRSRTATIGGLLGTAGSMAIAGITTGELVLGKVAAGTGGAPPPALARQFDYGGTGLFVGPLSGLVILGLFILVIGLRRARLVPLAPVIAVVVGSLLFNFSGEVENVPVILTGEFIRLAGLAWLALKTASIGQTPPDEMTPGSRPDATRTRSVLSVQDQSGRAAIRCVGAVAAVAIILVVGCSSREDKPAATGAQRYCELVRKLDQQAGPPTPKQTEELLEAAPDEIKPDIKALLVDRDRSAEDRLLAWEKTNCP